MATKDKKDIIIKEKPTRLECYSQSGKRRELGEESSVNQLSQLVVISFTQSATQSNGRYIIHIVGQLVKWSSYHSHQSVTQSNGRYIIHISRPLSEMVVLSFALVGHSVKRSSYHSHCRPISQMVIISFTLVGH